MKEIRFGIIGMGEPLVATGLGGGDDLRSLRQRSIRPGAEKAYG